MACVEFACDADTLGVSCVWGSEPPKPRPGYLPDNRSTEKIIM